MKKSLVAASQDQGSRVDAWLAAHLKDISRSKIQKWVKNGDVTVNGKTVTPHFALSEGDKVEVDVKDEELATEIVVAPNKGVKFDVVYEDADIIIIDKPTGLLVHPAVPADDATLANGLIARWPEIAKIGDSPIRPGIVHRLDKDASGLLVIARSKKAYTALKKAFQAHKVDKTYTVVVEGAPSMEIGTIDFPIGRKTSGGKMASRPLPGQRVSTKPVSPEEEADRYAVTHYEVLERYGARAALLKVNTETGRTHQVRVHMLALGCPVAGDKVYGTSIAKPIPCPRLFLHAGKLAFTHPITKKKVEFEAPLPKDLQGVLTNLRAKFDIA